MTGKSQDKKIVEDDPPQDILGLVVDNSDESQLALDFVYGNGLNPQIFLGKGRLFMGCEFINGYVFDNSFKESSPPFLVVQKFREHLGTWGYSSLSGVRAYLRNRILDELKEGDQSTHEFFYWRDIDTYYPSSKWDKEKGQHTNEILKLVTCFNQRGERIFKGSIDRAPHKLEEPLNKHGYKDWQDVSSWEIGGLDELQKMQDEKGIIIKPETRTVLFWEELQILREGREIIVRDSRSMMHVTYEAYFNDEGIVRGLHASMVD